MHTCAHICRNVKRKTQAMGDCVLSNRICERLLVVLYIYVHVVYGHLCGGSTWVWGCVNVCRLEVDLECPQSLCLSLNQKLWFVSLDSQLMPKMPCFHFLDAGIQIMGRMPCLPGSFVCAGIRILVLTLVQQALSPLGCLPNRQYYFFITCYSTIEIL